MQTDRSEGRAHKNPVLPPRAKAVRLRDISVSARRSCLTSYSHTTDFFFIFKFQELGLRWQIVTWPTESDDQKGTKTI